MNRLRQKLVILLTVLAFLCPQIAGATKFELVEIHETAGFVKTQSGALMPVMKMHAVLDLEIYSSKNNNSSDTNNSSPASITGHRHCSFSLAGCLALMDTPHRFAFMPEQNCRVRPSQLSMTGFNPAFVLPPPKRHIQGAA